MNTTPKEQDGDDGVAAAHGSRPSLDQTVLGVAPPAVAVSAATSPMAQPAATAPPLLAPLPAPPASAGSALVAAPTIAVSNGSDAATVPPPSAPALDPRASEPRARAEDIIGVGATLPLGAAAPLATPPRPRAHVEPPEPGAAADAERRQRTELSADYLRAARDAALSQVAASAAPAPRLDPAPVLTPPTPVAAHAGPDAEWLRPAPPSRTMPPSLGSGTRPSIAPPYDAPSPVSSERPSLPGNAVAKGFEPVPVLRAPLAESLSGAFGPIAELGGHRPSFPPPSRPRAPVPRAREASSRWLLLSSVALATVGVVTLGERLASRYRASRARDAAAAVAAVAPSSGEVAPAPAAAAASTLLANRPAPERGTADGPLRVISATGSGAQPASGPTTGGASPESQLAATAGRHVLSGNYAEALPVYQQLQRTYPDNTAYAAMVRLLGEKLAASHDTRTVTPTSAPPRGARGQ